jgi:hypothetical protein
MKCPNCGLDVGPEDDFCGECGVQLPRRRRRGLGLPVALGIVAALAVGACLCLAVVYTFWPSEPTATSTGQEVLWQDAFSDPGSGWEVGDYPGGSVKYEDGAYLVVALSLGHMWGVANRSFGDGAIEVDTTQVIGPSNDNNGYGIICRVQSNGDGYYFRISGDGFYGIHKLINGEFELLVDWAESDVINQGNASNHIRAVCNGSVLELAVNGESLAQISDSTFTEGDVALVAGSFEEDEATEISFDNLVVYPASTE